ncbi:MAG: SDR family oxidoreductase [Clostridia bacterium]|nr:SDR family oxidoreductase [Clostridia bacterium]
MATIFEKLDQRGKTVIITGGYRGIGLGIVENFAQAGANIAICGRTEARGREVEAKYRERGVNLKFYKCDIQSVDEIDDFVDQVVADFGQVDVLVNNAGVCDHVAVEDTTQDRWDWVLNTNLRGPFFLCKKFGEHVISRGGQGSVVSISSISAFVSMSPQKQVSYNASKAGICAMTQCLAFEWATKGIRVNAVCPGYIESEMLADGNENAEWGVEWTQRTPMGHFGRPEDIGAMVLFLASDASSYTTGSCVVVDGGYMIL